VKRQGGNRQELRGKEAIGNCEYTKGNRQELRGKEAIGNSETASSVQRQASSAQRSAHISQTTSPAFLHNYVYAVLFFQ